VSEFHKDKKQIVPTLFLFIFLMCPAIVSPTFYKIVDSKSFLLSSLFLIPCCSLASSSSPLPSLFLPPYVPLFPSEQPSQSAKRTLILVSKILQALATGVCFGKKEEFMTELNKFIEEYKPFVDDFLERVLV
jgi:hypothetical protein